MAIFTNKHDRENVPLLVQLAQIDASDPGELQHAYILLSDLKEYRNLIYIEDEDGLAVVAEVCNVVRGVLNGLSTENAVPTYCLEWLNEKQKAKTFTDFVFPAECETGAGVVPIHCVDVSFSGEEPSNLEQIVIEPLTSWLAVAIHDYRVGGNRLFIPCLECGNPFLFDDYDKPRQLYCSRRCADRVGHRRRYQSRKENAVLSY